MTQGSHETLEAEYYRPAYHDASTSRNYKYICDEFPPHVLPNAMEGNMDDPECKWTYAICPYKLLYSGIGPYDYHLNDFVVAIDGGCRGNGTVNARAAISVYFGPKNMHNFIGTLDFDPKPTSQKAELCAAIKTLEIVQLLRAKEPMLENMKHLIVKSDSTYVVNSMTEYICKWRLNGFKTSKGQPVRNRELIEYLDQLTNDLKYKNGVSVFFWHITREYNRIAHIQVNVALNTTVVHQKVYIFAPEFDNNPRLTEMYSALTNLLQARAQVSFVTNTTDLTTLPEGPNTRFLLMSDDVAEPRSRTDMTRFAARVHDLGSRVVFGGLFATMTTWTSIDELFHKVFQLPWRTASYTKDDLKLYKTHSNYSTDGLVPSEYVKALFLKNVAAGDVVYRMRHGSEAYAACSEYGAGFVGYIGDVNCEALFIRAVIALLGLPPVYDDQPFRLKTKATRIKEVNGRGIIDRCQVDF